uniref:Uncharacterized protein n=1 Tax=Glossina austeni TaxID=7395 RepID=A0A1A9UY09_GLOAU
MQQLCSFRSFLAAATLFGFLLGFNQRQRGLKNPPLERPYGKRTPGRGVPAQTTSLYDLTRIISLIIAFAKRELLLSRVDKQKYFQLRFQSMISVLTHCSKSN